MENEMADAPRSEGFRFGMTPAPVMDKNDPRYIMTSVEQFSIPAAAKNPELAKDFLRFLYSDQSIKLFAEKANGIYAVKGANELVKGVVSDGVYDMFSAYEGAVSMVVGWSALPKGSRVSINDEMFNPVSAIMNLNATADDWAAGVEKAFAQIRADKN
nr:extracellular solute-binding protein [uncultured Sphaerochaeta sp.]